VLTVSYVILLRRKDDHDSDRDLWVRKLKHIGRNGNYNIVTERFSLLTCAMTVEAVTDWRH